jgi:hypothetical protein
MIEEFDGAIGVSLRRLLLDKANSVRLRATPNIL